VTVPCPSKPPSIKFDCSFRFSQVSKKDIVDAYSGMKNRYKTTPDVTGFSPIMLSHAIFCPSVTDSLISIVSNSLVSGVFPDRSQLSPNFEIQIQCPIFDLFLFNPSLVY
jgi:hypothetical protein